MTSLIENRLFNAEVLDERARNLGTRNGLSLVFVTLDVADPPLYAELDLEFYNSNVLADIEFAVNTNNVEPTTIFSIIGGSRLIGGNQEGQVQVAAVISVTGNVLRVRVEPVGDYSTYCLNVSFNDGLGNPRIDPLFDTIDFKFRPGCFNINCAPEWEEGQALQAKSAIDYLARDFDSFKHVLINAMRERVPNWEPTSEADLDMVIVDLLAADADEISDYQDRVMQEATIGTARKRVSLARHARLMDYHIHQGNHSATYLTLQTSGDPTIAEGFGVWTGDSWDLPDSVIFTTRADQACFDDLNKMALYTWDNAVTALEAGSTSADLVLTNGLGFATLNDAEDFLDIFLRDDIRYLVIEEKLNPETGTVNGRDIKRRQLVQLLEDANKAIVVPDPAGNSGAGAWCVRVSWQAVDMLRSRYCFVSQCAGQPPTQNVSAFHGNIILATHGRQHHTVFRSKSEQLAPSDNVPFVRYDEVHYNDTPWGVICQLPHERLAYLNTSQGGDTEPRTTLRVEVTGFADPWQEQIDFIESRSDNEHFIVETDEYAVSRIRFGSNQNAMPLPEDAQVDCFYQVGLGSDGNIGSDKLTGFDAAGFPTVSLVHNPFDVTDGRDKEPVEEILRRVPEAYRSHQLRAVTLIDYVQRAEALPEVSHAYARNAWTGSWRTVQVSIDPTGTNVLTEQTRQRIADYLNAVRLIGEDLEVRQALYVSLDIKMTLCVHSDYWPEDLDAELEQAFSDSYTADGQLGFFHPDQWSFGQALYASQLIGRALSIKGVERILKVSMRRWHSRFGPATTTITINPEDVAENLISVMEVQPFEVIRVGNDPDHLENGRILFELQGGRQ